MKKIILILTAVCFLPFFAQAKEFKVGYVNFQQVLNKTSKGKKARKTLDKLAKKYQKQIKAKESKLKKMRKKFEKKQAVLSQKELAKSQENLQINFLQLQKLQGKATLEIQKKEKALMVPVFKQLEKAIKKVAQSGKYDLVLRQQFILWADSSSDVTSKVVKAFDKLGK